MAGITERDPLSRFPDISFKPSGTKMILFFFHTRYKTLRYYNSSVRADLSRMNNFHKLFVNETGKSQRYCFVIIPHKNLWTLFLFPFPSTRYFLFFQFFSSFFRLISSFLFFLHLFERLFHEIFQRFPRVTTDHRR